MGCKDACQTARIEYLEGQVNSHLQRLKSIENLSKFAWQQVRRKPEEAEQLFEMIYKNSRISEEVTCSCVGGKKITISTQGCGEPLCKAIPVDKD